MSGILLGPGYLTTQPTGGGGGGGNTTGMLTILSSPTSPTPVPWNLAPVPTGGNGPLQMTVGGGVYIIRADAAGGVSLKMWGAGGGGTSFIVPAPPPTPTAAAGSPGGGGGFTGGTWNLIAGETYTCVVGAGGAAGSPQGPGPTQAAARQGAAGGGATGIEVGNLPTGYGANIDSVIAVAGGGGGAGARTTSSFPLGTGGPSGAFIGGGGGGATAGDGSIGGYGYSPRIGAVYYGGGGIWNGSGTTTGSVNPTPVPSPASPVVGPTGPTYYRPDAPPLQNWGGHSRTGNVFNAAQPAPAGWAPGGSGSYNNTPSSSGPVSYGGGGGGGGFRGGGGAGKWTSPTTAPPSASNNVGGMGGGGGSGYFNATHISGGSTLTGQGGPRASPPTPNTQSTAANNSDPEYSPTGLWGRSGLGGTTAPGLSVITTTAGNPGAIVISLP